MTGSEFNKPVQPIANSNVREPGTADKKSSDRGTKIAQLKARIEAGQYHVDTRELSKRILNSGILNHD